MVNVDKIVFDESRYFMPNYNGTVKVSIVELRGNGNVLVKQFSDKKDLKPFVTQIAHIYNKAEDANKGRRAWEASKKRSKR